MKLLLHICCAPCAIYPLEDLHNERFSLIAGFFYNPNIHPYTEYRNRKTALEKFSSENRVRVFFHKYDMKNFFRSVAGTEECGKRCSICWQLRLEETARFASQNGFTHFTTTLLVSPYQDQSAIKEIGDRMAKKYGVEFFYKDFKAGFAEAQRKARSQNLYRQKYCGCIFSEQERFEKGKFKLK